VSNLLLSRLTPYVEEMFGNHQCEFLRYRSTADRTFCIRQILEKRRDYNVTVRQLFIDYKTAYDSVMRDILYNILIEFGTGLVKLIKMCVNKAYGICHQRPMVFYMDALMSVSG
jgi:hypothetical protein